MCDGQRRSIHTAFFFFNDTATTEIYTLSLHDALPIWPAPGAGSGRPAASQSGWGARRPGPTTPARQRPTDPPRHQTRSEEHTSELQSRQYLVCRLLLEKKKKII